MIEREAFDSTFGKGQSTPGRAGRPEARRVNSRSEGIALDCMRAARTATALCGRRAGRSASEGSVPEAQGNADAVAFASMPPIAPADGPVLITGASGYIGSWAVYAFVRRGYTVQ